MAIKPLKEIVFPGSEDIYQITVDSALSSTSENPVQNKVIQAELEALKKSVASMGTGGNSLITSLVVTGIYGETPEDFNLIDPNATGTLVEIIAGTNNIFNLTKSMYYIERIFTYQTAFGSLGNNFGNMTLERSDGWVMKSGLPAQNQPLEDGSWKGYFPEGAEVSHITKNTEFTYKLYGTRNDGGGEFSNSCTIRFAFPIYYGVGEVPNINLTNPVDGLTKEEIPTIKGVTKTITIEDGNKYIWFFTTEEIDNVMCSGFNAGFEHRGQTIIGDVIYNYYRTASKLIPGTYVLNIN